MNAFVRTVIVVLVLAMAGCGPDRAKSGINERPKFSGNPQTDLEWLLPEGNKTVEKMDGIKRDPRLSQLHTQFQKHVREHYDWYVEYLQQYDTGEPLPFHENFGLTENEYAEMQDRTNKISFYSTGLQELGILRTPEGRIRFKGNKKLSVFESVEIDPAHQMARIGEHSLALTDTVNIDTDKNGFRSKWKGYIWRFEDPKNIRLDALVIPTALNVIQYKLTVGQLEATGRTLLSIECIEVQDGIKIVDVYMPVVL